MRLTKRDGNKVWFEKDRPRGFLCPREFCDNAYDCKKVKDRTCPYLQLMDKLAVYEDAEEQGRLVILPCKVGDTVFLVEGHSVYKSQVDSITLHDDGLWLDGTFNHFGLVYFSGEIGRNVFLTREEAEAALKGGQDDGTA